MMKNILLVEDNDTNLYLIKFMLEKSGFEVNTARDGMTGVKLATDSKSHLVIMDIQLPDIDGLEATKRIRRHKSGKDIPIVALTSHAMPGDREKAMEAGCTGYLEKPINPETFIKELEEFL
jgi:two-component system cell cycle response regulator DivK